MDYETYWNGEPCEARKVRVIVGASPRSTWWCAGLEGQERQAVEVTYAGQPPFYLDNEDGSGWFKVTKGRGSPAVGHSSLPVRSVIPEREPHPMTHETAPMRPSKMTAANGWNFGTKMTTRSLARG